MITRVRELLTRETTNKVWMIIAVILFTSLAAFLIGWMVFGWYIAPVEWQYTEHIQSPVDMNGLEFRSKMIYVYLLQEWNAVLGDEAKFRFFASQISDIDSIACHMAKHTADVAEWARLIRVAYLVNGYGCLE